MIFSSYFINFKFLMVNVKKKTKIKVNVPHIHKSCNFKQAVFIIDQNFNSDTEVKFKIFEFLA